MIKFENEFLQKKLQLNITPKLLLVSVIRFHFRDFERMQVSSKRLSDSFRFSRKQNCYVGILILIIALSFIEDVLQTISIRS